MAALREVFASFGIEFDREGRLPAGERRVSAMSSSLQRFGALVGGALVVNGIRNMASSLLAQADAMAKSAQQTGLTTREYQAFAHAADLAGVDAQAFGTAMGQLQRNAADAAQDGGAVAEAFARIGVSVTDANGDVVGGAELMRRMADGLQATENPTLRTAAAMELMGRSGRRLLPMLNGGRAGVDAMASELEALGGGFSPEFAARAEQINDDMTRFRLAMTSIKSTILLQFLPSATRGVQALTRWSASIAKNDGAVLLLTGAMTLLGIAAAAAAAKAALSWLAAGWPILVVVAFVALLALAVEDLWVTWRGGDSTLRALINEIWPGMVDGLDATDRAIIAVTDAIGYLRAAFELVPDVVAGVRDILLSALQPAMALLGLVSDLSGGMGIGRSLSRAAGTLTRSAITGRSLVGENEGERERLGVRARLGGGVSSTLQERTSQALRPERLRTTGLDMAGRQTIDNRIDMTQTIHVESAMDAEEVGRIVQRGTREELERQTRRMQSALVPQTAGGDWGWEE